MPSRADIDDFLDQHTIAFVGVSRDPKQFANSVYRAMRDHGYHVVPVNPNAEEIEGDHAYPTVEAIPEAVDGALVMVPAGASAGVVRSCDRAGVRRVWLHKGAGPSSVSDEAVAYCRDHGLAVVDGACPMMWMEPAGGVHRLHRGWRRLTGRGPR